MDPWYPAPSEDTHHWEGSNLQLISDGYEFTEVPWYPPYGFTHVGPTPPGPTSLFCVSTQPDVAVEQINLLGRSIIAAERQEVTPNLLFPHQPSPQPSRALPCPHRCRPSTSHTPQTVPRIPCNTPIRMPTPSLSNEEARRILDTWILNSDWLDQNRMEPMVGDHGVPTCALQLAPNGESIYCCFLIPVMAKKGKVAGWRPATDPTSKPDRHQRAIGKERARYGHCPFKCPREHDPDCNFKACSKESLSDHLAPRNNPKECPQCSKLIAAKNMERHLHAVHRQ